MQGTTSSSTKGKLKIAKFKSFWLSKQSLHLSKMGLYSLDWKKKQIRSEWSKRYFDNKKKKKSEMGNSQFADCIHTVDVVTLTLLIQRSNLGMHQSLMLVSGFESGEILITFITLSFNVIWLGGGYHWCGRIVGRIVCCINQMAVFKRSDVITRYQ